MHVQYDNHVTIFIAENPRFNERMMNIEINCVCIHDDGLKGVITTMYVSSFDQLVNIFTRCIAIKFHDYLVTKLDIFDLCTPY